MDETVNAKCYVFVATSLDGYIAGKDDALDWLDEANKTIPAGEDCGFKVFMDAVDILVMGRISFEKVLSFKEWPYGKKRVIVMSSGNVKIPKELQITVSSSSKKPLELIKQLSDEGIKRIYVDGGNTIQRFLSESLISELTITILPILLGEGKPLFGKIKKDMHFDLIDSKAYNFGFVKNTYKLKKYL